MNTNRKRTFYYATSSEDAECILQNGFQCLSEPFPRLSGVDSTNGGIWVSDIPLLSNDGLGDESVIQIDIQLANRSALRFQDSDQSKPYHEWCIPVELLNQGQLTLNPGLNPDTQPQGAESARK